MTEKPFAKLFRTPNSCYVYDANKSEMLTIEDDSFHYLHSIYDGSDTALKPIPLEIKELMSQGYLQSESTVKLIKHVYTDYLDVFLVRKLSKVTLQLTQKCNFRCKYCIYSEEHSTRQRSHTQKSMSWDTAKKAVDFLREHSVDSTKVNVGFYGGEPLLEFSLLVKIVHYCKDCFAGKELTFNITTNGTLLSDEAILFFEENDISLMISLDGPKVINDVNRVYPDGSGTFDVVAERINRIKEIAPEYAKKMQISMVMDPGNDFDCINEIYLDDSDFRKLSIQPSLVEREYGDERVPASEQYIWKLEYQRFLALLSYYNRYPKDDVSPVADKWLVQAVNDYPKVENNVPLHTIDAPSGPCIPGQLRLFVNVDGQLFPCERVSETSTSTCIGTLDNGFYLNNAEKVLNVGALTEASCKSCWCFRHCSLCVKKADDGSDTLSAAAKLSFCHEAQINAYSKLQQYLLLKEMPLFYADQIRKERETV